MGEFPHQHPPASYARSLSPPVPDHTHIAAMKLLWFLSFLALLVAAYAVKDKDCVNKPGYECEEYDDEEFEEYCTDDPEAHGQFTTVCGKACEPFLNLK